MATLKAQNDAFAAAFLTAYPQFEKPEIPVIKPIIEKNEAEKPSKPVVRDVIHISTNSDRSRSEQILDAVCKVSGLKVSELRSDLRWKDYVYWRQITVWLLRTHTPASLSWVGNFIGGRHHTSALHAYCRVRDDVERFRSDIERVESLL